MKNHTKRLESTQAQLGGKVAELRELKMSTTRQLTELKKLWVAVNTTKQEKDNLTDKVPYMYMTFADIGPEGFT